MSQTSAEADHLEVRIARLFWVYISALALLFVCVVASLVITDIEARQLTTDAQRINLSGRQRTHSQRIINLAGGLAAGNAGLAAEFAAVVDKFEEAHTYLLEAAQGYPVILDSYLETPMSGKDPLDSRVRDYITAARALLEDARDGGALNRLRQIENSGLLNDLDQVVALFESNSTNRVELLRYLEFFALISAIAIVTVELFFVFRPGHELLKRSFADLRAQNGRLVQTHAELENSHALLEKRSLEIEAERARLDAALADSEALRREQASFTYALSHDLKSPANTIGLLLDEIALSLSPQDHAEAHELIAHGKKAIGRMSLLIKDTLDYSLATNNRAEVEQVDMQACVQDVLSDLRAEIEASGAMIEPGELCMVYGYSIQLRMLVQNLISNAIRYRSPDVPPHITISCTSDGPDGPCLLRVSDNGIGIAPEDQSRIFGLFQRLHLQTDYPGSGLGLATCQRIALNHAGDITVQSTPGKGSTFEVTLNRPLLQIGPTTKDMAA